MTEFKFFKSDQLRNFFLWIKSKEFLVFLFFFMVSGFFWLMLAVKDETEKELSIPIVVVNIPKNVVLTESETDTLKVFVRDYGYNIIKYDFKEIKPVEINFSSFNKGDDGKLTLSNAELEKQVRDKLEKSAQLLSMKPEKLDIYYNYGESKMVPVVIYGTVTADDKYFLIEKKVVPDSVKVVATAARLAKVDSVYTRYVTIKGVTDKVTDTVGLQKISGVAVSPRRVVVEASADILSETKREVKIVPVNVPEGKILRTFPSKVTVMFVTGANIEKSVKPTDFTVEVDYNDVKEGEGQLTLPLHLRKTTTKNVKHVKLAIKDVDYTIEEL